MRRKLVEAILGTSPRRLTVAWRGSSEPGRPAYSRPADGDGITRIREWDLAAANSDLGTAIGYPGPLPADAVDAIYPLARAVVDRTPSGMFDPPVGVSTDAPVIDKLVALTGRHPSRR